MVSNVSTENKTLGEKQIIKKLVKVVTVGVLSLGLAAGIGGTKSEASAPTKPAGSNFLRSDSMDDNYRMVQDSKGKTIRAKTTAKVSLKKYNNTFSYSNVSFVDYDKVKKVTYKTSTSIQAYTKASTKSKLTARNYKGKVVNVKVPAKNAMTKHNTSWYKDSFSYKTYVKTKGKWVKKTKTATVYIPAKYVKKYTSNVWTKYTKKAKGYFYTPQPITITLKEYKKVEIGMTYKQVVAITGEKMTLTSDYSWNETVYDDDFEEVDEITHTYRSYEWEYENDVTYDYRFVDFYFDDNKLTNKSQSGLK